MNVPDADSIRLRELADEQAALRHVATLVAGGARPAEVFTAVADELGRLIGAQASFVSRLDNPFGEDGEQEGYVTVVGSYGLVSDQVSVGFRTKLLPERFRLPRCAPGGRREPTANGWPGARGVSGSPERACGPGSPFPSWWGDAPGA